MSLASIPVRIYQKNNYELSIEWSDGHIFDYELAELQRHCMCAQCSEPRHKTTMQSEVRPRIKAKRIQSVGRFGLQITFVSGCSQGIYDYQFLKEIGARNSSGECKHEQENT